MMTTYDPTDDSHEQDVLDDFDNRLGSLNSEIEDLTSDVASRIEDLLDEIAALVEIAEELGDADNSDDGTGIELADVLGQFNQVVEPLESAVDALETARLCAHYSLRR